MDVRIFDTAWACVSPSGTIVVPYARWRRSEAIREYVKAYWIAPDVSDRAVMNKWRQMRSEGWACRRITVSCD